MGLRKWHVIYSTVRFFYLQSKIDAMAAVSSLSGSVTTPGAALLMASTMASIIGQPPAPGGGSNSPPSTLGIEVQSQAVNIAEVSAGFLR